MSKDFSKEDLHTVIAAAVHSVLDEPFRIVSVEPIQHGISLWNIHGRLQQFDAHRLR